MWQFLAIFHYPYTAFCHGMKMIPGKKKSTPSPPKLTQRLHILRTILCLCKLGSFNSRKKMIGSWENTNCALRFLIRKSLT